MSTSVVYSYVHTLAPHFALPVWWLENAGVLGQLYLAVDQTPGGNALHLGFCVPRLAIHKVGVGGSAKEISSQFTKRTFFDPPILVAGNDGIVFREGDHLCA